MLLIRKLRIFSLLTFVGVVLMTVSFVSPGWVNCKVDIILAFIPVDKLFDLDHNGYPTRGHMSAGLQYFIRCIPRSGSPVSMTGDTCPFPTYPLNFERWLSAALYYRPIGLTKRIMVEIQIMSWIGIFFAVLGFIGAIVYTRTLTKSRWAGLLACISLSFSGWTYIAAIVKLAIAIHEDRASNTDWSRDLLRFYCPWSFFLGQIGCLFILVSAIGHLYIVSRNRTDNIHVYHIHKGTNQGIVSQHSYTVIAPPGYHATVGLKVPLVGSMEKTEEANFRSHE